MTDSTRVCIRCGETKPLTSFPRDGRLAQGRGSRCNSCAYRARNAAGSTRPPSLKPPKPTPPLDVSSLLAWRCDTPSLPGAACRGRWSLTDPPGDDETPENWHYREAVAKAVCSTCPALSACRSWLESLPAQQRPVGVVAGRLITKEPRKPRGGQQQLQEEPTR